MALFLPPISHIHVSENESFLQLIAAELHWTDLSNQWIMDVGCGNSNERHKFCLLLLKNFPKIQKILGIDSSEQAIRFAKCRIYGPKVEYHVGDIEDAITLSHWMGKVDKVISKHCFHQLNDQEKAFRNVYHLLKPGGEAAILFCVNSGYVGWHTELASHDKWSKYYADNGPFIPLTQFDNLAPSHYRVMLEKVGFTVILCREECVRVGYNTEADWKAATFKLSKSSFSVPTELEEEFKHDLFDIYMKHNGRNDEGQPCQHSTYMTILIRK